MIEARIEYPTTEYFMGGCYKMYDLVRFQQVIQSEGLVDSPELDRNMILPVVRPY